MISTKQITYALAVGELRHFKQAANQCAVSQSALSTAISELEKALGFAVFERDNKKVLITPLGDDFLARARNIANELDNINKLGSKSDLPLSIPLRIGVIPTIAPYFLPLLFAGIEQNYPHFSMQAVEDQSHVLVDAVKKGKLDTAILALPYDCEGLLTLPFWDENFYWVSHKDEQNASKKQVSAQDITQSNLMLLKDGHCLKDHALAACSLQGNLEHRLSATSLHTLVQMAAGKNGTTLVPYMALEQLVHNNKNLIAAELSEPGPHRSLAFIVRPNFPYFDDIQTLKGLSFKVLDAN